MGRTFICLVSTLSVVEGWAFTTVAVTIAGIYRINKSSCEGMTHSAGTDGHTQKTS